MAEVCYCQIDIISLSIEIKARIDKFYLRYNRKIDFEEPPEDKEDIEFLMECRYMYEDYTRVDDYVNNLTVNLEKELYMNNEEKEYQDLLKQ